MKVKTSQRNCVECGHSIPVERLRLLPDTWTCVRCSRAEKRQDVEVDGMDHEDRIDSAQGNGQR